MPRGTRVLVDLGPNNDGDGEDTPNPDHLGQRWNNWQRHGFEEKFDEVLDRIRAHGGCLAREVGEEGAKKGFQGLIDKDEVTPYDVHPSPTRSAIFDAGKTSRINVAHFMALLMTDQAEWSKWRGQMPVIYNRDEDIREEG